MSESLWVARLIVSQATATKVNSRHDISVQEIQDAILCVSGLTYAWDPDPERGLRALVKVEIRGHEWVIVLYPVDDPRGDVYALGSAYLR